MLVSFPGRSKRLQERRGDRFSLPASVRPRGTFERIDCVAQHKRSSVVRLRRLLLDAASRDGLDPPFINDGVTVD
jgi:hypothetical protein